MSKALKRAEGGTREKRRQEMSELVLDQESSGLSQRAYCEAMEISLSTLAVWRRKLGRVGKSSLQAMPTDDEPAFVELRVIDDLDSPTPAEKPGFTDAIEVTFCNGVTLKTSWGMPGDVLHRLTEVLSSPC